MRNPVEIKGTNSDGGAITLDGQFATQTVIAEVRASTGLAIVGAASGSTIKNLAFAHFGTSIFLNNVNDVTISCNSFSADVINESSIFGISVSNLDTKRNTFTTTTTDTNGIFLTNPTGKIAVKKSSFDGFSDATADAWGDTESIEFNHFLQGNFARDLSSIMTDSKRYWLYLTFI